jgi:hypothetical protein
VIQGWYSGQYAAEQDNFVFDFGGDITVESDIYSQAMTLKAGGTVHVKNDIHTEAADSHDGSGVGGAGTPGMLHNWQTYWSWRFGGGYIGSGGGGGHGGVGGKSSRASGESGKWPDQG